MEVKGNTIELSTFLRYGLTEVIGHKSLEKEGKTLINLVWCKICEKFKRKIINSSTVKGSAKKSALAFIDGTSYVTKYQVRSLFNFYYLFLFFFCGFVFFGPLMHCYSS